MNVEDLPMMTRQQAGSCLYRHFDQAGVLLYVGVSLNAVYRLSQHRDASHWFYKIAQVTIEQFENRQAALDAERKAITAENPAHNIKRPPQQSARVAKAAQFAEDSRHLLVQRLVRFDPLYSMDGAGKALGIGTGRVKGLIEAGRIGFVTIGNRRWITGWQLIEYIEALETGVEK